MRTNSLMTILAVAGLLITTACGSTSSEGPSSSPTEEDDLTASKAIYVADLGPAGIEFFARRGGRLATLSAPGTLTGGEEGSNTGSVRVGAGEGCADCLFFQHPTTKKWINVARPNNRSVAREKARYSYEATGYVLTSPIVSVTIAPNDPDYGELVVTWP